ncbi:MAG: amidohydrolase family protein [Alphaproteobacteria bacterium]|nr:amidohydrolase family protein [Alphaproteobacteria bacterium]
MDYDIKITGGLIVDGTGSKGYHGDVGIKDGKVVAMGKVPGSAAKTIDADGKVVCPGFVDIHTHYDAQVIWDRMLTISPWHGVTTVVMGNCGFSVAPTRPAHRDLIMRTLENVEGMTVAALREGLGKEWPFETFPEYLDAIESRGTAINVGALVGHTAVRLYVMGEESTEREATPDEIAQMRKIVYDAIEAGAVGFATSKAFTHVGYDGRPVPSRLASFDEIRQLAGALGEAGKGMIQATVGAELAFDQFETLYQETKRPISWTALLSGIGGGGLGVGTAMEQLKRSDELIEAGNKVYPQVTCRALCFELQLKAPFIFESHPAFKPVSQADLEGKKKIYASPEFHEQFREVIKGGLGAAWNMATITYCPSDPSLEERRLADVAKERGVHLADFSLDLALTDNLETRFRIPLANSNEEEVAILLKNKNTVLGLSDAGAHASQLCDACFSTYLLGHWVREKNTLTIEEAVRMLTSRPAEVFGITDRGTLKSGVPADVVVFDPETVGTTKLRRVHDFPAGADRLVADAYGIDAVIVNGVLLRLEGVDAFTDASNNLAGKLLRNGCAA